MEVFFVLDFAAALPVSYILPALKKVIKITTLFIPLISEVHIDS